MISKSLELLDSVFKCVYLVFNTALIFAAYSTFQRQHLNDGQAVNLYLEQIAIILIFPKTTHSILSNFKDINKEFKH